MDEFNVEYDKCGKAGTVIYVASDGKYIGCIVISDKIKKTAHRRLKICAKWALTT
ncbi:MAG: hypothetical protein L6V93_07955 [Clostridiales bacterium]|nr:MAG: hypothetical protein L6V93_07955 [Clostridiales bacterium]